ncbi:MAG TPA: hypothetical protein VJ966_15620, partial [Actinomycetes bacterium]|nr:hypothetical protein [Actinomycetes bacterium]
MKVLAAVLLAAVAGLLALAGAATVSWRPVVFLGAGLGVYLLVLAAGVALATRRRPALHGLGFYAYQYPQSAAARPWADPRPALARLHVPALVVKGSCDYLSWSSGQAYLRALPGSRLAYLH